MGGAAACAFSASESLRALFFPSCPCTSSWNHPEVSVFTSFSASSNSLLPPNPPRSGRQYQQGSESTDKHDSHL